MTTAGTAQVDSPLSRLLRIRYLQETSDEPRYQQWKWREARDRRKAYSDDYDGYRTSDHEFPDEHNDSHIVTTFWFTCSPVRSPPSSPTSDNNEMIRDAITITAPCKAALTVREQRIQSRKHKSVTQEQQKCFEFYRPVKIDIGDVDARDAAANPVTSQTY